MTHSLEEGKIVDWTHEREWRWPCRCDIASFDAVAVESGGLVANWYDIPGLDFYQCGIQDVGVIVETKDQANLIVRDMLSLVDSGVATERTFGFVLASNLLPAPSQLQDPMRISQEITKAMFDLDPFFSMGHELCEKYSNQFYRLVLNVEAAAGVPTNGEVGGCWLWLHDNTAPLTRALIRTGRASVSRDGRYLVPLLEFSDLRSLRERESMATLLAEMVLSEFHTPSCYFSVFGSDDPNGVPFYTGEFDDTISFFNCSWHG